MKNIHWGVIRFLRRARIRPLCCCKIIAFSGFFACFVWVLSLSNQRNVKSQPKVPKTGEASLLSTSLKN